MVICEYCGKPFNVSEGAYDDGDCMCPERIAGYIEKSGQSTQNQAKPSRKPDSSSSPKT